MFDHGSFGLRIRSGRWLSGWREPALQVRTSVFKRAAHRLLSGIEHRRDLLCPEAEDVPQDEDSPLTRWQQLEGRHEREGDGLACFNTSIGTGAGVCDSLEEKIRVGLQPHHVAGGIRLGVAA
jgi:hypothetical protein